ncbi:unnamed protein product [Ectocarpus sp. 6 AP-2014]
MASRDMDILVVGASGFTGAHVCKRLARSVADGSWAGVSWGIAGRSRTKLEDKVLAPLRAEGLAVPGEESITVVDNSDAAALRKAVGRARLCLNCTGPYRFLGEAVVSACVDSGTDYIDLCGEPEFMQRMTLKFHEAAEAKGVLIMHACAFDSVPADLGCLFAAKQFVSPAVCSSVSSFVTLDVGPSGYSGHATTFEAAVHGFGSAADLRKVRKEVQAKFPPSQIPRVGARPAERGGPFYEQTPGIEAYCFKFPGADSAVVRSTQNSLAGRGEGAGLCPHYSAYFTAGQLWGATQMTLFGGVFQTLAKSGWGRNLLLNNVGAFSRGLFSHEGPTEDQMNEASYAMTFLAKGYSTPPTAAEPPATPAAGADLGEVEAAAAAAAAPAPPAVEPDVTVVTRVKGPEPGYVATPIIFLAVARCLLEERSSLPVSGGVHTPGSVLVSSSLVDRLGKDGVTFEVVG